MDDSLESLQSTKGETFATNLAVATNLIPYVGSIIAGVAQQWISNRKSERLEKFLANLETDLEALKGSINQDFLKKEDAKNLFEEILETAQQTVRDEQWQALEKVLVITYTSPQASYSRGSELAETIKNLNASEFELVRVLADPMRASMVQRVHLQEVDNFPSSINAILLPLLPGWDREQLERTWKSIYSKQLVSTPDSTTTLSSGGNHQVKNRLSEFGRQVAKSLS